MLDGTKIVKEYRTTSANSTQTNVKYYFYDASGSIAGFEYNGNKYYFQKNIQGDIIRICDTSGNTVAEYTYDAWGKILSIKDGSGNDVSGNASHIANINPFRYRGYYYDTETGFNYLQTRYYDPEVGRFLNADCYIGANGDIPGYNMFAYCSNNPVMCSDFLGKGFFSKLWKKVCKVVEVVCDAIEDFNDTVNEVIDNIREDLCNLDLSNDNPQKVYNAHYISAYKDKLAIKLPIGNNAFSFGAMFIGDGVRDADTINHEYGHTLHFDEIGPLNYMLFVGIPSLYGYWTYADNYYSQEWEYIADELGGVNRNNYLPNAKENAEKWRKMTKSPLLYALITVLD